MTEPHVQLAWEESGRASAPPLVLVHSLGADRSLWDPVLRTFEPSYRVIRLDLRGHGASPAPKGPYTLEQLAHDVLGVADAAGIREFAYCGVSLGGLVGLFLAARHPERIAGLVVANATAKIGSKEGWEERIDALRKLGMQEASNTIVGRWFAPSLARTNPDLCERFRRIFAGTDPDGYAGCCGALATGDVTSELGRISAPTLVVAGELDVAISVVECERLGAGIAESELLVIEGAGHLSCVDQSERFASAVGTFLRRLSR